MARCGMVLLSPLLTPMPSTSASVQEPCSTSIIGRRLIPVRSFIVKRVKLPGLDCQHLRPRAHVDDNDDTSTGPVTTSSSEKEDLSEKLAAAEADAEALRKELAVRRGNRNPKDLSKLNPATPEKRIDGTGYRETIFSGPGKTTGKPEQQPSKWGLSEAEMFLSKGAPTEGTGLGGEAMEAGSEEIVTRRLIIGVGVTVLAVGLAFVLNVPFIFFILQVDLAMGRLQLKFPVERPSKPLFLYLVFLLRLQQQLKFLEDSATDVEVVKSELEKAGTTDEIKANFLSAAAWLEGADAEKASSLAYNIFEYLDQADYSKYFENYGQPSATQQMEFLKFSLQSIKAARQKTDEFLTLVPSEALDAAKAVSTL